MIRVLCLVAFLLLATAAPAAAHTVAAGADLRIAQTIAGAEVTVVIKGTSQVPGPLRVGVIAYQPVTELPVALEVRSVDDGHTVKGTARAARDPQYVELRVEHTGPHELTLRAGNEVSVVPFRVLVSRASAGEFVIYVGLFAAGLLLVGGLLTGALSRPGPAMLLAGGAAAGLTVAFMVVVFEPTLPASPPDGAAPKITTVAGGRPFVQARVATVPERPAAGEEFTLRVDLVDGSTGRPVDDLVAHHEALAHVVVTSEDGRYFRHLHPLRTAPGRLEVRLRTDRGGRFLTYAELEREDSGGQLVTGEFNVTDKDTALTGRDTPATGKEAAVTGKETTATGKDTAVAGKDTAVTGKETAVTGKETAVAGKETAVAGKETAVAGPAPAASPVLRPAVPVAGRPETIELGTSGTVRPWLGMTGHLIVRSQDGAFLGHVHEMGSPGPTLRFTFTFPAAGKYLAWIQYATGDRIETVPFTMEVVA